MVWQSELWYGIDLAKSSSAHEMYRLGFGPNRTVPTSTRTVHVSTSYYYDILRVLFFKRPMSPIYVIGTKKDNEPEGHSVKCLFSIQNIE